MEVRMRALSLAIVFLATATAAAAQGGEEEPGFGGGPCGYARSSSCSTPGGNEASPFFELHGEGPGWHEDVCRICKSGGVEVEWIQCHPTCGGGGDADFVYMSLVKAASVGDMRTVLMLAPYAPKYAVLNTARCEFRKL
jgi:hypothetical protein